MTDILYRWAVRDSGGVVNIREVKQGEQGFRCPACGDRMKANIGRGIRKRHFAHIGDNSGCSPESQAHWMAKQFFGAAIAASPLIIEGPCRDSKHVDPGLGSDEPAIYYSINGGRRAGAEGEFLVPGAGGRKRRADVLLESRSGSLLGIEFVVSSPVPDAKRRDYEAAGVQGVIINLSAENWEDELLPQLSSGILRVDDTINVDQLCITCARRRGYLLRMDGTYLDLARWERKCKKYGCAQVVWGIERWCDDHVDRTVQYHRAMDREDAARRAAFYQYLVKWNEGMEGEYDRPPNPNADNTVSQLGHYAQKAKDRTDRMFEPVPPPPGIRPPRWT